MEEEELNKIQMLEVLQQHLRILEASKEEIDESTYTTLKKFIFKEMWELMPQEFKEIDITALIERQQR